MIFRRLLAALSLALPVVASHAAITVVDDAGQRVTLAAPA